MKTKRIFHYLSLAALLVLGTASCNDDDKDLISALDVPAPSMSDVTVSSLTFRWDKVAGATQYAYELTDPAAEVVEGGTTTSTTARFTGLQPATTYTLTIWAYGSFSDGNAVSEVAVLTATTAAVIRLAAPEPTVASEGSSVVIAWTEVEHADFYTYSYEKSGQLVTGSVDGCSLTLAGLPVGEYSLDLYADSNDETYSASEVVSVSFLRSKAELWRAAGTYTSEELGGSWDTEIISYDDGSYTIPAAWNVEGYDLEFSVNDDGTITVLNGGEQDEWGYYNVPTGRSDIPEMPIWPAEGYSKFSGDSRSGELRFFVWYSSTSGTYDKFVWGGSGPAELWRAEGTYYTNYGWSDDGLSDTWDDSWSATIAAYDDGTYRILAWYGVDGYDLEFSPKSDGITVLNYTEYAADYGTYKVMTSASEYVWIYPDSYYSFFEGDASGGSLYIWDNGAGYCYHNFVWGGSSSGGDGLAVDDLVGSYSARSTGMKYTTEWVDFDQTDVVTVTKKDDATLIFNGLYWDGDYPITATVDLAARTLTFPSQMWGIYRFCPYDAPDEAVVATFDDDGTIRMSGWTAYYDDYATSYVWNAQTTMTKR